MYIADCTCRPVMGCKPTRGHVHSIYVQYTQVRQTCSYIHVEGTHAPYTTAGADLRLEGPDARVPTDHSTQGSGGAKQMEGGVVKERHRGDVISFLYGELSEEREQRGTGLE